MSDATEALEADLGCGTFDGVNGAEEAVDIFRIVVAFEREQAVADDLEVFFGLRLEELENFVGDFVVCGKRVKVGTCLADVNGLCFLLVGRQFLRHMRSARHAEIQWWRIWREREAIAVLKSGDVFDVFLAGVADFEQASFEQRDAVREELGERAVKVLAERRVQRVLEDVCELSGNFRFAATAVAQRMLRKGLPARATDVDQAVAAGLRETIAHAVRDLGQMRSVRVTWAR